MKVINVNQHRDFVVTFEDGVQYTVLEGVVPAWMTNEGQEYSSDILFIMDITNEDWKLVDWVCGITLMSIDNIVELCKELKERG